MSSNTDGPIKPNKYLPIALMAEEEIWWFSRYYPNKGPNSTNLIIPSHNESEDNLA